MIKEFVYSDIFNLLTQSFKVSKLDFVSGGKTPAYSSDTSNNGRLGFVDREPLFCVTHETPVYLVFGDHTRSMNIVREDFCVMDNVKVLAPKFNMSDELLMYVITSWKKAIPNLGYARHWSVARVAKFELPVIESADPEHNYTVDDIDWEYMQERITELEQERITKLDAYLKASGLDDYELTDKDKEVLSFSTKCESDEADALKADCEDGQIMFKSLPMNAIFKKLNAPYKGNGRKQDNVSKSMTDEFSLPLINCKFNNNGIMYYGRPDDFVHYRNVLSIIYNGPPTEGQTYFQDAIGVYTDAYLVGLKEGVIPNREVGLYLTAVINASIHNEKKRKYSRGHKATWEGKVENDEIIVPVNAQGKLDFGYMERYIRAIEKLSIAHVAKYKDSMITATRHVVGA